MKIKYAKFILLFLLLAGVVIVYSLFDPASNKFFPSCPFYTFTGMFCPGCGSQRALHYLLTGNILSAINSNILLLVFLPFLFFYYSVEGINLLKKSSSIKIEIVHKIWFIYSVAAVVIVFWILRNLSFNISHFLAPH